MFDEISGIDRILTDLHVGFPHSASTTKIRFKVDSRACANLLPFKVLKCIEPSVTVSKLHDSIDHSVCLYAYNKHVIKQFGVQHLRVSSGNKTKVIPFFIVDSRFNPIVGLSDSVALKLIKLNTPMYNTWSSNNPVSTIAAIKVMILCRIMKFLRNSPKNGLSICLKTDIFFRALENSR